MTLIPQLTPRLAQRDEERCRALVDKAVELHRKKLAKHAVKLKNRVKGRRVPLAPYPGDRFEFVVTDLKIDRVRAYALIHLAADDDFEGALVSLEHAERERIRLVGEFSGFAELSEPDAVRHAYMRARKAMNHVHGAVAAARTKNNVANLLVILDKYYSSLPPYIRAFWDRVKVMIAAPDQFQIQSVRAILDQLWRWTAPSPVYPTSVVGSGPTRSGLTLTCWYLLVPPYDDKLADIYQLAQYWKLTESKRYEWFCHSLWEMRKKYVREEVDGRITITGAGPEIAAVYRQLFCPPNPHPISDYIRKD